MSAAVVTVTRLVASAFASTILMLPAAAAPAVVRTMLPVVTSVFSDAPTPMPPDAFSVRVPLVVPSEPPPPSMFPPSVLIVRLSVPRLVVPVAVKSPVVTSSVTVCTVAAVVTEFSPTAFADFTLMSPAAPTPPLVSTRLLAAVRIGLAPAVPPMPPLAFSVSVPAVSVPTPATMFAAAPLASRLRLSAPTFTFPPTVMFPAVCVTWIVCPAPAAVVKPVSCVVFSPPAVLLLIAMSPAPAAPVLVATNVPVPSPVSTGATSVPTPVPRRSTSPLPVLTRPAPATMLPAPPAISVTFPPPLADTPCVSVIPPLVVLTAIERLFVVATPTTPPTVLITIAPPPAVSVTKMSPVAVASVICAARFVTLVETRAAAPVSPIPFAASSSRSVALTVPALRVMSSADRMTTVPPVTFAPSATFATVASTVSALTSVTLPPTAFTAWLTVSVPFTVRTST